VIDALVAIADESIQANKDHILNGAIASLEWYEEHLDAQLDERLDSVDTFFETLRYMDETDTWSGRELMDEVVALTRLPIRFSNSEQRLFLDDPDTAEEMVREQVENALTTQTIVRLLGALDRRLPEDLDLNAGDLDGEDWQALGQQILDRVEEIYEKRRERFLSDDQTGSIVRQLQELIGEDGRKLNDSQIIAAMSAVTQEQVTSFDKKTHKRIKVRKSRFSYLYHAANLIADRTAEEVTQMVADHLLKAYQVNIMVWGQLVWRQVSHQVRFVDLPEEMQNYLTKNLGADVISEHKDETLSKYPFETHEALMRALGRRELTEAYRGLILRVISELWIDYLTKMEALRISIGLEAYGQRDPLVAYKSQASEMFQNLFSDMQASVVNKMFTYRPRVTITAPSEQPAEQDEAQGTPEAVVENGSQAEGQKTPQTEVSSNASNQEAPKKKKRRRRRR
jgi:preprotein translocase subunit SecA